MKKKTPEEVLRSVSADLKMRGETHATAAQKMGYGSKQTLSNLLSSKKYMSGCQAKNFYEAFGYNMEYLMFGKGELLPFSKNQPSLPYETAASRENTIRTIADTLEHLHDILTEYLEYETRIQELEHRVEKLEDIIRQKEQH